MRIKYYYDIISPSSWLGYQILRQKLPIWKKFDSVEVEYVPVPSPYISNKTIGYQFGDTSIAERNYQFKHFRDIVNHYGLEQANFERMYNGNLRSKSALLFLNVLRNEHPRLQTHFMERFWHDIFVKNLNIDSTNDFLRVARESDIQYSFISDVILKIEQRENALDFENETEMLIEERAIAFPWIKVNTSNLDMSFSEILRFELIDEIIRDPLVIPQTDKLNRISAF